MFLKVLCISTLSKTMALKLVLVEIFKSPCVARLYLTMNVYVFDDLVRLDRD